jgi:hypothetical protein
MANSAKKVAKTSWNMAKGAKKMAKAHQKMTNRSEKMTKTYRKASKINTKEIAPLYIPTFPYCLTAWRDKSNGKCAKKY